MIIAPALGVRISIILCCFTIAGLAVCSSASAQIIPAFDLGDAPDSSNAPPGPSRLMTAYPIGGPPGVSAQFPTIYGPGSPPYGPLHRQPRSVAWLGESVTLEDEAHSGLDEDRTNNIIVSEDRSDLDGGDDGVIFPLVLPHCGQTSFRYVVTVEKGVERLFVNAWFDLNRDGDWDDMLVCPLNEYAYEWAVQNQAIGPLEAGTHTLETPRFTSRHLLADEIPEIWMRITLSEIPNESGPAGAAAPGYGGSGPVSGYETGETEDYYFIPLLEIPPTETPTRIPPSTTPTPIPDTDGDGIPDNLEARSPETGQTNLYLPDSDGDGLSDGTEDANHSGGRNPDETDARDRDTDSDGFEDGIEVLILSTDALDAGDPGLPYEDQDQDGLPLSEDPDDTVPDVDGDRIQDGYEAVTLGLPAVEDGGLTPAIGDMNEDGPRDNADAQLILNFFAYISVPEGHPKNTDVNRDAFIDNADAQILLTFFAHLEPFLPW